MQAQAKIIQSPYSGEYIKPHITTREDANFIYTEANYVCPSSGNFVQKVVLSTEEKKKVKTPEVVEESLGALAMATGAQFGLIPAKLLKWLSAYNLAKLAKNTLFRPNVDEPCNPDEENCDEVEENSLIRDDQVLDHDSGMGLAKALKDIVADIEEITGHRGEEEKPSILANRSALFNKLKEVRDDVQAIVSNIKVKQD